MFHREYNHETPTQYRAPYRHDKQNMVAALHYIRSQQARIIILCKKFSPHILAKSLYSARLWAVAMYALHSLYLSIYFH